MNNETKKLYNGVELPLLGLGTWQIENNLAAEVVENAIKLGYRHIDTAAAYENEEGVGRGVLASGVNRNEIFITSKIPAEYKTYEIAVKTIEDSLKYLKTDYIDLMLIHAPRPWDEMDRSKCPHTYNEENLAVWRALEEAYHAGKLRAIGVSNFNAAEIENIMENSSVCPMVNQVRSFVGAIQWDMIEFCKKNPIVPEAYSPLGHGGLLGDAQLVEIAEHYGVSLPRLCIKYVQQLGMVALPKTTNPDRMRENAMLDFVISDADMEILRQIRK